MVAGKETESVQLTKGKEAPSLNLKGKYSMPRIFSRFTPAKL